MTNTASVAINRAPKAAAMKPTAEQAYSTNMAIDGKSLVINAYAGTGKSTNLKMIAKSLPNLKILYVTFGKENVVAARKTFPKNVFCATAHALAYKYVDSKLGLYKNGLVKPSISVSDFNNAMGITPDYGNMESHIKYTTVALNAIVQFSRTTDTFIGLRHVPDSSNARVDLTPKDKEISLELARQYWDKACNGYAPITHDMYLKMWQIDMPTLNFDLILFDEAQDADLLMVDVVNNQSAQKIIVGDDHQQIYSFRGAVNALDLFGIDNHSKLTQSWRYGPKIAKMANKLIFAHKGFNPNIRGNPGMNTEIDPYYEPYDVMIGRTMSSIFEKMAEMYTSKYYYFTCLSDAKEMSSVILSILALISNSRPPDLNDPLPKKYKKIYHPFIAGFDTYDDFVTYTRYAEGTSIATYQSIVSKYDLDVVFGVLDVINGKMPDDKNGVPIVLDKNRTKVKFMTAHKCKGLEFNEVTLLGDFNQIGSKKWNEEETNLAYVAGTRAMKRISIGDCDVLREILYPNTQASGGF